MSKTRSKKVYNSLTHNLYKPFNRGLYFFTDKQ